jgi:hypothetical protein
MPPHAQQREADISSQGAISTVRFADSAER